ncbi:MAG: heme biosynthesis protein HemY [Haliea sp.]|nr:heme biosynthesis protein HemY [Haliea sp.]MDP4918643.1 heme biosynthesis protein HemY [Haliea sp.]
MRGLLILALLALLLGVGIVALIENHPGYVLVAYGQYTVETSLWVGLVLLAVFVTLLYLLIGLLRKVFSGQRSVAGWLGQRKARRAARLTHRGLISFIEGNWVRARSQLLSGAAHSEVPLLNYLTAARASFQLDEPDKMREYLGIAEQANADAGIAVALTQAELKLQGGHFEQAVATLERARRNAGRHPHVLKLLHSAYRGLEDWDALLKLLPELRKHGVLPDDSLLELERSAHTRLLERCATADGDGAAAALQQCWEAMPASLRQNKVILRNYVDHLIRAKDFMAAAKLVQRALKQEWDGDLVRLFGYVELPDAGRQLAQAEAWLTDHPRDHQLLLTLGRLACRHQLWGKARDYFEGSYRQRHTSETCAELGRLLAALGEDKDSALYFREGLLLREKTLPVLPAPQKSD